MGDPALLFKCEYGGYIGRCDENVPRHSPQSARSRREKEKEKEKEKERGKEEGSATDYDYTRSGEGASRVEEAKGDLEESARGGRWRWSRKAARGKSVERRREEREEREAGEAREARQRVLDS
jgi:hypothetical protein